MQITARDAAEADLADIERLYTAFAAEQAALRPLWHESEGLPSPVAGAIAALVASNAMTVGTIDGQLVGFTRQPEPGFAGIAHAWTLGASLEDLFGEDDFGAGDFVRNGRQLLDLLRQLRDGFPAIAVVAADAVRAIDRGVVASGGRM